MHIDEYLARRGITPDDTVVVDDPCAIFDGAVEMSEGLDGAVAAAGGRDGADAAADGLDDAVAVDRHRRRDAEERLARAADTVRDILG